jgi:hypothetical protein
VTAGRLTRLNADGTFDTGFAANIGTGFATSDVFSTSIQSDGKIIVGGEFSTFKGIPAKGIARLNADGTLDT